MSEPGRVDKNPYSPKVTALPRKSERWRWAFLPVFLAAAYWSTIAAGAGVRGLAQLLPIGLVVQFPIILVLLILGWFTWRGKAWAVHVLAIALVGFPLFALMPGARVFTATINLIIATAVGVVISGLLLLYQRMYRRKMTTEQ